MENMTVTDMRTRRLDLLQKGLIKAGLLGEKSYVPPAERKSLLVVVALIAVGFMLMSVDYFDKPSARSGGTYLDNIWWFFAGAVLVFSTLKFAPLNRWFGPIRPKASPLYLFAPVAIVSVYYLPALLAETGLMIGVFALSLISLWRMPEPTGPIPRNES